MILIQPILKYIEAFTVTGLCVKTQNSDEFDENTAKLPSLWRQFYSSKLFRTNTALFSVYFDYESDASGFYTVTVGTDHDHPSAEYSKVKIHPGNYLVFQNQGIMPSVVIETWKQIWAYFTSNPQYERNFISDFEAYIGNDEIAVYIGIR